MVSTALTTFVTSVTSFVTSVMSFVTSLTPFVTTSVASVMTFVTSTVTGVVAHFSALAHLTPAGVYFKPIGTGLSALRLSAHFLHRLTLTQRASVLVPLLSVLTSQATLAGRRTRHTSLWSPVLDGRTTVTGSAAIDIQLKASRTMDVGTFDLFTFRRGCGVGRACADRAVVLVTLQTELARSPAAVKWTPGPSVTSVLPVCAVTSRGCQYTGGSDAVSLAD